jgi:hypothetical protein
VQFQPHGRQAIGGLQVTATELNGDRTSIRFFRRQIVQRKFMILTAIFMALSVSSLSLYAALASRAKGLLVGPELSRWVSRVVEVTFIGFGAASRYTPADGLRLEYRQRLPDADLPNLPPPHSNNETHRGSIAPFSTSSNANVTGNLNRRGPATSPIERKRGTSANRICV